MADFDAGGKVYPGKPDFFGDNGDKTKVADAALMGTGKNVPDHADKNEHELTFPR